MSSTEFVRCLIGKAESHKLSEQDIERLGQAHARARSQLGSAVSPDAADRAAADAVSTALRQIHAKKRQRLAQAARAQKRIEARLEQHPNGMGAGAMSLVGRDPSGKAGGSSMETRQNALRNEVFARAGGLFNFVRPKGLTGAIDQQKAKKVLYALLGDARGREAQEAATAWREAADWIVNRANGAGADIRPLENFAPREDDPQLINALIRKHQKQGLAGDEAIDAARAEYVDDGARFNNRADTLDFETGQPVSPEKFREMLADKFDAVRTYGLSKVEPGNRGRNRIVNQLSQSRVFHHKDADAFFEHDKKYGSQGDYFGLLTGHLKQMARDVGTLEVLGPDPDSMARFIEDSVRQHRANKAIDTIGPLGERIRIGDPANWFRDMYERGSGFGAPALNRFWPTFFQDGRNILTSAQLAGAAVSSVTDVGLGANARRLYGLSQSGVFKQYFDGMQSGNIEMANHFALGADIWTEQAFAAHRLAGEMFGSGWTRRLADVTMRVSGLSGITQAGRHGFGLEFLAGLTKMAKKSFDELPQEWLTNFQRTGIYAADWDAIRRAPQSTFRGQSLINPVEVSRAGHSDAATRLTEMIDIGMQHASPGGDLRTRSIMALGQRDGTISAEIAKSLMMYKGFPITVITTHLASGFNRNGGFLPYAIPLFIGMTMFGALAVQAKDVLKGRDPRPMDTPEFWLAAALQGGGLGIFGDFLFDDVNRYGDSLGETAAGPFVGAVDDIVRKFGIGNVRELLTGEDTNAGRELAQLIRRYTPIASSLWYTRAAFERLVADQIELLLDPDAAEKHRRAERRREREYGQRSYWRPGQLTPDRAPSFAA